MKILKCHCGAIEANIDVAENFEKILRCNCSLCKRKGAVMSMVKNENFKYFFLIFFKFELSSRISYFLSKG